MPWTRQAARGWTSLACGDGKGECFERFLFCLNFSQQGRELAAILRSSQDRPWLHLGGQNILVSLRGSCKTRALVRQTDRQKGMLKTSDVSVSIVSFRHLEMITDRHRRLNAKGSKCSKEPVHSGTEFEQNVSLGQRRRFKEQCTSSSSSFTNSPKNNSGSAG